MNVSWTGARCWCLRVEAPELTAATDPYGPLASLADKTNSVVPPAAFGGTQCLTGFDGLPVPLGVDRDIAFIVPPAAP
ncbi:MAG: hypothetical protein Q8N26_10465 [Myxococcales bacterium]|nr:hypothetical protein [Myxococcales bacterium]